MIESVSMNQSMRVPSAVLNDVIMDAVAINPTPTDKGKRLKIFYATQVAIKPPTFVIFREQRRANAFFLRTIFRKPNSQNVFIFEGTPIRIIPRRRK